MDIGSILFIAFVCFSIGFITSRLFSSLKEEPVDASEQKEKNDVLKVWRDDKSGDWLIEMDGTAYRNMIELDNKDRNKIQQILLQLNQWLTPEAISGEDDSSDDTVLTDEEELQVSYNPVTMFTKAIQADVPKIPPPAVSIVGQIDEILQEKLKLQNRGDAAVRLMEWPGQGMVVMIGLERYNEIEDVPDQEIRDLIRLSVNEWEQTQEIEE